MSLDIKRKTTHRLAKELAKLTGESLSTAVGKAVEERLQRVRATKKKDQLAERLLEIGRECSALFKEPYRSIDHGELLYDEKGLPK